MSVIYEKITLTVATPYFDDQEKSYVSALDSVVSAIDEVKHGVILIDYDSEELELIPAPPREPMKQEAGDV
jgi:hypothetical protein